LLANLTDTYYCKNKEQIMSDSLWPSIQETFNAFGPHYQNEIQAAMAEVGFEGADWFFSYLAYGMDPEPLTAESLQKMLPYFSKERLQGRLSLISEHGFLENKSDDKYSLTAKGHDGIESFFVSARLAIAKVTPMSSQKMDRLAKLLGDVVEATAAASEPAAKPNFQISRRTKPDAAEDAAVHIDQYLTDLLYFRDDAHIAAWQPQNISGQAWETFSLVWQGDVHTLAELVENRQNRGFDESAYAKALHDLVKRGWLTETNGHYQLTETGKQLRQEVEALTNTYFLAGFATLTETEIEELSSLLIQLKEGLFIPEETPVPA
jgi:predicted transcriptional regulator